MLSHVLIWQFFGALEFDYEFVKELSFEDIFQLNYFNHIVDDENEKPIFRKVEKEVGILVYVFEFVVLI